MLITHYFVGQTLKLSGYTFDTEKKIYKHFALKKDEWSMIKVPLKYPTVEFNKKENFKLPSELYYIFNTKRSLLDKLTELEKIGFTENSKMKLDFGLYIK